MALSHATRKAFDEQRAFVLQQFSAMQLRGWYGTVTFKVEGGVMKRWTPEESHIPPGADAPPFVPG